MVSFPENTFSMSNRGRLWMWTYRTKEGSISPFLEVVLKRSTHERNPDSLGFNNQEALFAQKKHFRGRILQRLTPRVFRHFRGFRYGPYISCCRCPIHAFSHLT